MSLTAAAQTALRDLIRKCKPLSGTYFRSVERRFMDPAKILNGLGTQLNGGRFAPTGMRGVYLANSDSAASAEVLARKKRLGGDSQISLDRYPRVVFAVGVELERVVSFIRKPRNPALTGIWNKSRDEDIRYSQEVGKFLAEAGMQALLFKSTIGTGRNLLVFLGNCTPDQLKVRKLDETMEAFRQIVSAHKS